MKLTIEEILFEVDAAYDAVIRARNALAALTKLRDRLLTEDPELSDAIDELDQELSNIKQSLGRVL